MNVLQITMSSFTNALVVPADARLRGLMDKAPPSELLCIFLPRIIRTRRRCGFDPRRGYAVCKPLGCDSAACTWIFGGYAALTSTQALFFLVHGFCPSGSDIASPAQ